MLRKALFIFGLSVLATQTCSAFNIDSTWPQRIQLGGTISFAGLAGDDAPTTIGIPGHRGSTNTLILNYADFNMKEQLEDWLSGYTDIAYAQTAPAFIHDQPGNGNILFLESAYLTLGKTACFPYYLRAGLMELPFGGLNYSSNMETFIQLLSLNAPPALQLGIEQEQGFSGSMYVFTKYKLRNDTDSTKVRDYGFAAMYRLKSDVAGFRVGAGYITNILSNFFIGDTTANNSILHNGYYTHRVPAFDLQALFNYHQFEGAVRYIGTFASASLLDVPYTTNYGETFRGAKLAGWSANLGYHFYTFCLPSRLVLGYEGTSQAAAVGTASGATNFVNEPATSVYNPTPTINNYAAIGLPRARFFALFKVFTSEWSQVSLELDDYFSYAKSNGGTNQSAFMAMGQLSLKYS